MERRTTDLKSFLHRNHSAATVKIYAFEINHFINHIGKENATKASYSQLMNYLAYLRKRYDNPATVNRIICALKIYFDWLVHQKKRTDNPCRSIRLQDLGGNKDVQIQDLLTDKELELLFKRIERFPTYALKNQVVMGLLVYQALRTGELVRLKTEDVQLEKGHIIIRAHGKLPQRILKLQAIQILPLHQYISESRPQLIKQPTERLILSGRGTPEKGEGIQYLVSTFRPMFPTKHLTPSIIRKSVIANLLKKGRDLRLVQAFAGHIKPSSTERYRQNDTDALKQSVHKYHPLK